MASKRSHAKKNAKRRALAKRTAGDRKSPAPVMTKSRRKTAS